MQSQKFAFAFLIALPFLMFYTPAPGLAHAADIHSPVCGLAHAADIDSPIVQTSAGLALKCRRSAEKQTFPKDDEDSEEGRGLTLPTAEEEEEEEDIGLVTYPRIFIYTPITFHQPYQTINFPTASSQNPHGYWYAIVLPLPLVVLLIITTAVLTLLVVSGLTMLGVSNRLIRGRAFWIFSILVLMVLWGFFFIGRG